MTADFLTETIEEGLAEIQVPKISSFKDWAPTKTPVFYNPRMKLNRDLAVVILNVFQDAIEQSLIIGEPMTGCGVRGVRYALEVKDVKEIFLNDLNPEAAKLTRRNVKKNRLSRTIKVENKDANVFSSLHSAPKKRFNVIDVDPFGTPSPFIDSAVRALQNNGLIALTATDMAPLCGVHPKACIRKYFGRSLRTEYCHELAVRLLAGCLALQSAKHDFGVQILFSHSTDHYVRVYGQIQRGAKEADNSVEQMGHILHCFHCFNRKIIPGFFTPYKLECEQCGRKYSVAGPLWIGQIFDKHFSSSMFDKAKMLKHLRNRRLNRLLSRITEETDAPPTYYVVDRISDKLGLSVPPKNKVIEKLRSLGYIATHTHFNSNGVRTDAPAKIVKEIITDAVNETI